MKNTMKAIAALIISATMISITACGNTDNTLSAAPKATTTAASETTEMGTVTSRSATTTSISATSNTSASSSVTSSAQGSAASTTTKSGTTTKTSGGKTGGQPASNGGTVNNGGQSYSHSTSNNGSGNNSYSNDNNNNNSYQPQQTERQTERQTTTKRQTTTTAKKTQAPKPKPTTTTTAKPKFELTQNDIDRVVKELQQYSNETCDFDAIFYTEQEMWDNIATRNLDNSSWGTPDTVSPDTYSSYDELYRKVKGHIDVLYDRIGKDQAHIVVYQQWHGDGSAINSDGKPAWEIYLLY